MVVYRVSSNGIRKAKRYDKLYTTMKNLAYLLALHSIDGLGNVRLKNLLDFYQDPKLAWRGNRQDWQKLSIPKQVISLWQEQLKTFDPESYLQEILGSGVMVLTWLDSDYPPLLKEIYDPPLIIYYKGEVSLFKLPAMAVVGTRQITSYGKLVTERIVKSLVQAGLVVVSGLARGVDTTAHQAALLSQGKTIAVLGAGLNNIYPAENRQLSEKIIASGGLVICEHPPSYAVTPGVFPARNRIISGLSLGVVITEAAIDSGSLITARAALDQGREVFAVPGQITSSLAEGPLSLIKQGAKLVTSGEDILDELGIEQSQVARVQRQESINLSELEQRVLQALETEQKHIDEICRMLKLTSAEVAGSLVKMEIKGLVKNMGGGVYLKL